MSGAPVQKSKHPAAFSKPILTVLDEWVQPGLYLDPFAGTSKIMQLENQQRRFVCVELEKEWAEMHPETTGGHAGLEERRGHVRWCGDKSCVRQPDE